MSIADIAVVAIVVVAGLMAFSLGFVRVVLALLGWVGAAFATMYGFSYLRPFAREWISVGILADAAAGAAIFIATLIVLTIISHAIGRRIRSSALSAIDRSLGLVFGLFLGAVVVSVVYLGLVWAIDLPNQKPDWYRTARTRPVVEWSASRLLSLAPPEWRGPIDGSSSANGDSRLDSERAMQKFIAPRTVGPAQQQKAGYGNNERRDMDRLIKSHQ
ncbi:MAG: CvpA family protein [Alphaproteobacteria bacterium]